MRRERDEIGRNHDEAVAALASLRNEKLAADAARADLESNLGQTAQDQRVLTVVVEQISEQLRRMQDRASAREQQHDGEINALRTQLLDSEAALANQARQRGWRRFLPTALLHRSSARRLVRSGLFDVNWYCAQYPDVPQSEFGAAEHYLRIGCCRGYKPNPLFDTRWYLRHYEDVRRSGVNPLIHYLRHGFREGRDPGPDFNTEFYLEGNPDVRARGKNPLAHYLHYGASKGDHRYAPLLIWARPPRSSKMRNRA